MASRLAGSHFLRNKPTKHMSYLYEHVFDGQCDNRVGVFSLLDRMHLKDIRRMFSVESAVLQIAKLIIEIISPDQDLF